MTGTGTKRQKIKPNITIKTKAINENPSMKNS